MFANKVVVSHIIGIVIFITVFVIAYFSTNHLKFALVKTTVEQVCVENYVYVMSHGYPVQMISDSGGGVKCQK